ncbi:MAG: hypothetical protein V4510_04420 [bacterium]
MTRWPSKLLTIIGFVLMAAGLYEAGIAKDATFLLAIFLPGTLMVTAGLLALQFASSGWGCGYYCDDDEGCGCGHCDGCKGGECCGHCGCDNEVAHEHGEGHEGHSH